MCHSTNSQVLSVYRIALVKFNLVHITKIMFSFNFTPFPTSEVWLGSIFETPVLRSIEQTDIIRLKRH